MAIGFRSTTRTGQKDVWITKGRYKSIVKVDFELSEAEAEQKWLAYIDALAPSHYNKEKEEVLYPIERFVTTFDEKRTVEQTQFGNTVVMFSKLNI